MTEATPKPTWTANCTSCGETQPFVPPPPPASFTLPHCPKCGATMAVHALWELP